MVEDTPRRPLQSEWIAISKLTPYAGNARTHSKSQIELIASSISRFGWTNALLIDGDGVVIAGHGRLEAAKHLGLQEVPVVWITDMTDAQKRAYILADNKIAELGGWDEETLSLEIGALLELDLDFSVELTGFSTGEIDALTIDDGSHHCDDIAPNPAPGPAISTHGDLWQLGRHKLICGNALEPQTYAALLGSDKADLVFTDPPYNVPIKGHIGGLGKTRHDDFIMAAGEMDEEAFTRFLATACTNMSDACRPGAIAFICMDWRNIAALIRAGEETFGALQNVCVWNKLSGGMGALYRSQHEFVPVFRKVGATHRNNIQLGRHGRNRTNVWDYVGVRARSKELKLHPTVKPTVMIADAIRDVTAHNDLVLDPFAGSGSTLLAAEMTGRRAACAELDPKYADLIIRRFEAATGEKAVHAQSGRSFRAVEQERQPNEKWKEKEDG